MASFACSHYTVVLRLHLLPAFGNRRLDQIDERTIDRCVVAKLDHITPCGKKIAPQSLNQHLKLLARLLNVVRKWTLIKDLLEFE